MLILGWKNPTPFQPHLILKCQSWIQSEILSRYLRVWFACFLHFNLGAKLISWFFCNKPRCRDWCSAIKGVFAHFGQWSIMLCGCPQLICHALGRFTKTWPEKNPKATSQVMRWWEGDHHNNILVPIRNYYDWNEWDFKAVLIITIAVLWSCVTLTRSVAVRVTDDDHLPFTSLTSTSNVTHLFHSVVLRLSGKGDFSAECQSVCMESQTYMADCGILRTLRGGGLASI